MATGQKKPEKGMYPYAAALNAAHLILCLLMRGSIALGIYTIPALQAVALITDIALWAIFSIACSLGLNDADPNRGVIFALTSLSPVLCLAVLAFSLKGVFSGWASLVLLGAPVNFYMRPLAAIAQFLPQNAYIAYLTALTALILTVNLAYAYGAKLNRKY